jgi:hypothetical protein
MERKNKLQRRLDVYQKEQRSLRSQLLEIGFIKAGSVTLRTLTCGKTTCACHQDPKARHGPYVYWTTKTRGKTVGRLLKGEEARLCLEYVNNRKRLDTLLRKWMTLSDKAFKTTLRMKAMGRGRKGNQLFNSK